MKYSFIKNLLQLDSNYCKNIFISILILIIGSCRHEKPTYTVNFSNTDPLIDGSIDTIWNNAEAGFIHQYYGEDVKDSMDFSAYFKILHNILASLLPSFKRDRSLGRLLPFIG